MLGYPSHSLFGLRNVRRELLVKMSKASQVALIWAMSILISGGLYAQGLRHVDYIAKDLNEVDDIFSMLVF